MQNKKLNIIIDTDPGVDDSIALCFALNSQKLDVKLITISQGNVPISVGKRNALYIRELYNRTDIPVAVGRPKSLIREYHDATVIHGKGGMGKFKHSPPKTFEITKPAYEAMYETICKYENNITIVTLGPLTNIALLLTKYPDVKRKISKLVIMAGSLLGNGNTNDWAEFNSFVDPEALQVVLDSEIDIALLPMEIGNTKAVFWEDDIKYMARLNKTGAMFSKMFSGYKEIGEHIMMGQTHDACAIFYLIDPIMFETKRALVNINTNDLPGKTTVRYHKQGPIKVIENVDLDRFYNLFFDELKKIKY